MYETIPPVTTEGFASLEVQTNRCSSTTTTINIDGVQMSERGSTASSTNLNVHPRARVVKDGFYQTPRSHPTGHDPNNYDTPHFSKSDSDTRLSSSGSMQHLPGRRQW